MHETHPAYCANKLINLIISLNNEFTQTQAHTHIQIQTHFDAVADIADDDARARATYELNSSILNRCSLGIIHNCHRRSPNETSTLLWIYVCVWMNEMLVPGLCPCGGVCAYFNFINFNFLHRKHAHEILSTVCCFFILFFHIIFFVVLFRSRLMVFIQFFYRRRFSLVYFLLVSFPCSTFQFVLPDPHEHLFDFHEMKWAYNIRHRLPLDASVVCKKRHLLDYGSHIRLLDFAHGFFH